MRRNLTFPRSHAASVREWGFPSEPDAVRPSWLMWSARNALNQPATVRHNTEGIFGQSADPEYAASHLVIPQASTTHEPILPRLAAGEPRAMNECINRHGSLVWGIVRRSIKDTTAAEDLVQEIFTEIWKKAAFFDQAVASEATFVALVARRRVIDFLRRQGRQPDFEPLEAAESIPATPAPSASLNCDLL